LQTTETPLNLYQFICFLWIFTLLYPLTELISILIWILLCYYGAFRPFECVFFGLKTSLPSPLILTTNNYRMPPQRTKDRKPTPTPSVSFFAPRPRREGLVPHDYNNIERNEVIPLNTLRPAVPPIISTANHQHRQSSAPPIISTANHQPPTINHHPSTITHQPSTLSTITMAIIKSNPASWPSWTVNCVAD
jgi:hypothetical protein